MTRIWRARTMEAAVPDTNVNARPRRVIAHFRPFLQTAPLRVVDVGTRGGIPGELVALAPHIHLVAIEPDPQEARRLEVALGALGLASYAVVAAAVGPPGAELTLHVTREPGRSSLLEPNREVVERYGQGAQYEIVARRRIRTRGLDQILAERGLESVDVLKLDVQGFELEVLKTLGDPWSARLLMIEAEVEFVELYRGQPMFRDLDEHVAGRGFELFQLARVFANYQGRRWAPYGRGQLQFGDAYYLRTRLDALAPRQIAKLIVLAACYGFTDYAYFHFRRHQAALRELGEPTFQLFARYFEPFDATRPGPGRLIATGLRLVLDRCLFHYLTWRRWNGLKTDSDRAYPIR